MFSNIFFLQFSCCLCQDYKKIDSNFWKVQLIEFFFYLLRNVSIIFLFSYSICLINIVWRLWLEKVRAGEDNISLRILIQKPFV